MTRDVLLAIETSTLPGSLALGVGEDVLAWRALSAERTHTAELLPALRDLLAQSDCRPCDVAVLCFSQGPGSFTGLRVAATVARLWQSATGCRVLAVPTLEVIACNALTHPDHPSRLAVIQDAKRGQLAAALYERVGERELRAVQPPQRVDAAAWLAELPRPCWVMGDGALSWAAAIRDGGLPILPEETWRPAARQLLAVGCRLARARRSCRAEEIVPLYLRPPECEEVYERRRLAAKARRAGR